MNIYDLIKGELVDIEYINGLVDSAIREQKHDFSWALDMLKQSRKVARGSWEGDKRHPTLGLIRNSGRAQVIKWAASGYAAKVWRPLQEDILANDWYEVQ